MAISSAKHSITSPLQKLRLNWHWPIQSKIKFLKIGVKNKFKKTFKSDTENKINSSEELKADMLIALSLMVQSAIPPL